MNDPHMQFYGHIFFKIRCKEHMLVYNASEGQLPHPAISIPGKHTHQTIQRVTTTKKLSIQGDPPSKVEHDKHDMVVEEGRVHLNIV